MTEERTVPGYILRELLAAAGLELKQTHRMEFDGVVDVAGTVHIDAYVLDAAGEYARTEDGRDVQRQRVTAKVDWSAKERPSEDPLHVRIVGDNGEVTARVTVNGEPIEGKIGHKPDGPDLDESIGGFE